MNIYIVGNPGSGKGTQAKLISKHFGLTHFSSGQALRDISGPDANEIKGFMDRGELVPDEIVLKMVEKYLTENKLFKNLIVDGSPRSLYQYEKFKQFFGSNNVQFDFAIHIKISDSEAVRRLTARREHKVTHEIYNLITNPPPSGVSESDLLQRADDTEESVKERIRVQKVPGDLLEAFGRDGILLEVDGERPVEVIFEDIVSKIENGKKQ